MRLARTAAIAGLAVLALSGCEQPPPGQAPQLEMPEVDAPAPDPEPGGEFGPVMPAGPAGQDEAPEPAPGEVTVLCDGETVLDYKPATATPAEARQICATDIGDIPGDSGGADPFTNTDEFQRDLQQELERRLDRR